MASSTITRTGRRRARGSAKPFLFVALQCDRPLEPGARFCIGDADIVSIGRGQALSLGREGKELRIGIPDPRMSSRHLRLESVLGGWVAEDLGSKNGTLIGGRRISRETLADGTVLELGHTFLLFRSALPASDDSGLLDAKELQPAAPGLSTLSPVFAAELERLRTVASARVPILLLGESGTGKEVLATAIHRLSGRSGPFQPVNCGAIPPNLIESQLFGHRRGGFTGAVDDYPGLVRGGDRGTLLLDEIGDLPLAAQAALLRVLQEEEVLAIGAARPVKVDLRVVSATHRDLDALVAQERFRPDLLARLSGYVCSLPPLRERREDFSLFVAALLTRLGPAGATFTPEAARALLRYGWPLNVRELEKCLASAVALAGSARIDLEHLPSAVRSAPTAAAPAADSQQRDELIALLREHGGNVTAVARAMGKARTQVQRWLRRFALDPLSFRR
jgi:transcriptional regulator with PAS, ATPase and Fis domain